MITKLHALLIERWETYETRRVELALPVENLVATMDFHTAQAVRLNAMRELMLSEMPDRWSDIYLNNGPSCTPLPTNQLTYIERTALSRTYYRVYASICGRTNSNTGAVNTNDDLVRFQSAECLFMIIMNATGDGEARSQFHESDIGDVDGDGAPEFLDGWGQPINFLRWAPGFESPLQQGITRDMALALPPNQLNVEMLERASTDHDPFDAYRRQPHAFRMVPLIYSAGPDEQYGILSSLELVIWSAPVVSLPAALQFEPNPYLDRGTGLLGMETVANPRAAEDNIHNHVIEGR